MAYKNKEDRARYHKNYYKNNREIINKRTAKRNQQQREQRNQIIRAAKSVPCMDCGKEYPFYVMDFDHARGEKNFVIAHSTRDMRSFTEIFKEIEKCDVVCSNCHRIRTHERKFSGVAQSGSASAS